MDSFPSGSGSGNTASGQQPPALVAEPSDSQCPGDQPVAVPDKASRTAIKLIAHEAPAAGTWNDDISHHEGFLLAHDLAIEKQLSLGGVQGQSKL